MDQVYPIPDAKAQSDYRNYDKPTRDTVREFYRQNHQNQTYAFVQQKRDEFLRLDRRQILESLLEPSKTIAPEYRTHVAVTEDGRSVIGLVVKQTADTVALVNAAGRLTELAPAAIDALEPLPTSLMPEHLLRDLTAGQAADLLAYLETLK